MRRGVSYHEELKLIFIASNHLVKGFIIRDLIFLLPADRMKDSNNEKEQFSLEKHQFGWIEAPFSFTPLLLCLSLFVFLKSSSCNFSFFTKCMIIPAQERLVAFCQHVLDKCGRFHSLCGFFISIKSSVSAELLYFLKLWS